MYFKRAPDKILDLRPDTLAQILTWSNVQSGSKVLLMETCKGLLTGAIMERLGNEGSVLQVHQGNNPTRTIVEQFNFSVDDVERLACSFPMDKLELFKDLQTTDSSRETTLELLLGRNYLQNPTVNELGEDVEAKEEVVTDDKQEIVSAEATKETTTKLEGEEVLPNNRKRKHGDDRNDQSNPKAPKVSYLSREKRLVECEKAMELLKAKEFDSLVIVARYHPKKLLLSLLEFLPIARPFVVYCQYKEPLMECFVTLRDMKIVTNLEITESWYRNLQVLSNRSHPEIVMSATGGYILRGIKISP